MTYLEVLTDICSRVADPNLDSFKERAKDHFFRAITIEINARIDAGQYEEVKQNIPGFIAVKADVDFSDAGDTEDLEGLDIFRILNFFMPPGTDKDVVITMRDTAELNKQSAIETLQPTDNDLFIYRIGMDLYGLAGGGSPEFVLGTTTCIMEYVKDISDNGWIDSTDLQSATAFLLTRNFTRTCIEIASKTLLDEVNL